MAEKAAAAKSKAAALKARATERAGKVTGHGSGFVNFIREQGVIGLIDQQIHRRVANRFAQAGIVFDHQNRQAVFSHYLPFRSLPTRPAM